MAIRSGCTSSGRSSSACPCDCSILGNNFATVVAGDNVQFTISQVTRGTIDMARKGDYAFLMPRQINPKGLVLSQLVLYKSIPVPAIQRRSLNKSRL